MGREPIRGFRDLEVYQRVREMVKVVHAVAGEFPDYEKYDLADQMRRASKSVVANITEGYALRQSVKEFRRYLRSSMASANEMESHIEVAYDLGYLPTDQFKTMLDEYQIIGRQLNRLIATWRTFDNPASSLKPPASSANRVNREL